MCHTSPLMYPIYVLGRYTSGVNVRFTIYICFFVAIYLSVCLYTCQITLSITIR